MKKIVILFLILLPQWIGAADCEYFTIDNEMLFPTDLDWNINNNGACTKNHISGVVYSLAGVTVVRTDVKNAIIGLKPVASWDGWYHYHVSVTRMLRWLPYTVVSMIGMPIGPLVNVLIFIASR